MKRIEVNIESIPLGDDAFDASDVKPFVGGARGAIPAGPYPMYISGMKTKENGKGTGHHLQVEYTVAEGEFKGRKVFDQWNLWHTTSDQALEIGWGKASAVAHATGQLVVSDLADYGGIVHIVEVDYEDATPDTINENNGETIKGRPARNNVLSNSAYVAEAPPAHGNRGGSPVPGAPKAGPLKSVPAGKPAGAKPPVSKPAAQQEEQEQQEEEAAGDEPAATGTAGKAPPPWKKK